jgi:hypothetical protein
VYGYRQHKKHSIKHAAVAYTHTPSLSINAVKK